MPMLGFDWTTRAGPELTNLTASSLFRDRRERLLLLTLRPNGGYTTAFG